MTIELKPCPFCGGKAKMNDIMGECWVSCVSCEAETPFSVTEKDTAKNWNKRNDTEVIEKLKKILAEYKTGTDARVLIVKVAGVVLEHGWAEERAKEKQAAPGQWKPPGPIPDLGLK